MISEMGTLTVMRENGAATAGVTPGPWTVLEVDRGRDDGYAGEGDEGDQLEMESSRPRGRPLSSLPTAGALIIRGVQ